MSTDYIWVNDDTFIPHEHDDKNLVPSDVLINQSQNILSFADLYYNYSTRCHVLKFTKMPVSFVAILSCTLDKEYKDNIEAITKEKVQLPEGLTTNEINALLFSCEPEE